MIKKNVHIKRFQLEKLGIGTPLTKQTSTYSINNLQILRMKLE